MTTRPDDWAFPAGPETAAGLSKREYFAAHIMAGFSSIEDLRRCPVERSGEVDKWRKEIYLLDARYCVQVADALVVALNEEPK